MSDTIILDLKKVSENGVFRAQNQVLFEPIHENTEKENKQLELDIPRCKIVVNDNGTRMEHSSIEEFLAGSSSLNDDQKQYILNVGQQGIFGGGCSLIPTTFIANMKHDVVLSDPRNHILAGDDVQLGVYIKGNTVQFINTINFNVNRPPDIQTPVDNITLSMVADISNIAKGKEQETPIYMIASQNEKKVDITGTIREAEGQAEEKDDNKATELTEFVRQAREEQAKQVTYCNDLSEQPQKIKEIVQNSIKQDEPLIDRQKALDDALKATSIKISGTQQEMEAKIYSFLTSYSEHKEAKRAQFGAQKVVEYVSAFEDKSTPKNQKPSKEAVSNILCALTEDGRQQKIIQKNAGLILRQATDSKNLGFTDRVKKLFDAITLITGKDKKEIQEVVGTIKKESFEQRLQRERSRSRGDSSRIP